MRLSLLGLCLLAPMLAQAAPAIVIKAGDLRARPFLDAPVSGSVAADAEVDTLSSEGAWTQVKTKDGKTGWLRMLNLRPKSAPSGASPLAGIASLGNVVRTGSTGATATTGAKGLSKEDLAAASPNEAEVRRLDTYRATADDARRHARTQKLAARAVDLPAAK